MEDIIIIGGGIIGTLIACQCARFNCNVTVIDKENDIANCTSMSNSAIIHAGYDPSAGSLKEAMNVRGARLYPQLCKDLKVDYERIGSLVVGSSEEELSILKELKEKADLRGIVSNIIEQAEIRALEPNISDEVKCALYCEETAIVTPWKVAIAAMEEAMDNGAHCVFNQEIIAIKKIDDGFELVSKAGKNYQAYMVINCAGLYADDIHEMACGTRDFEITPRKGEYFVLNNNVSGYVKHVIYPTPSKVGKGVLIVPTIHGNMLLGPTAYDINSKEDVSTTQDGLSFVRGNIEKIVKNVPYQEIIHSFSGNRPSCDRNDFIIEESHVKGFIDVAGIDSPGLASAPAIAEKVVQELILPSFNFENRMVFKHRRKNVEMEKCTLEERQKYIEMNPRYGEIICRCERVSAQEIINCIKRNCGARSVVGVKKRVRPGMGKCQGGFCEPLVVKLLAETLNISPLEVDYKDEGSKVLLFKSKGEQ